MANALRVGEHLKERMGAATSSPKMMSEVMA
jgi:hypothetical protein